MSTTTTYKKIALAGGTGALGSVVLSALIRAEFSITLLTREGSSSKTEIPPGADVTIKAVDYSSASSLEAAIRGTDALVITISSTAVDRQFMLIDAAIAAGVKRIIPSEFGCDTYNPNSSKLPVYRQKVAVQGHLAAKAAENPGLSYAVLMNNAFFDWPPALSGFLINVPGRKAQLFDGGDRPFSVSRLSSIAQGIVGILQHPVETANKALYIHDAVVTQNQLIGIAEAAGSGKFETQVVDLSEQEKSAYEELGKADASTNMMRLMMKFIYSAAFRDGYGGDFTGRVSNELLGVEMQTKQEIEAQVRKFL